MQRFMFATVQQYTQCTDNVLIGVQIRANNDKLCIAVQKLNCEHDGRWSTLDTAFVFVQK